MAAHYNQLPRNKLVASSTQTVTAVHRHGNDAAFFSESRRRRHSGRLSASANEAKVAYPAANRVKVEPADTDSGDDGGDDEDGGLSTRRMTRHAYAEEIRRARTKDDDASDAGPTRRGSLRRRSRSGTEHAHQGEPADGGDDDAAPARSVSDAVRTAWRLVPPEVIRGGGDAVAATMPSALYGCQHLLRLFGEWICCVKIRNKSDKFKM